ncbi:UNVERIFIED_CONTAM: hypothetical protein FKN15_064863 [Acipenser sinensis]
MEPVPMEDIALLSMNVMALFLSNTRFQVTDNSQLGNYTCVFDIKPEVVANFVVEVPDTEGREKPLVCYEGDAVVMICKSHEFVPNTWIWHKVNGTEKAIINATANPDRYKMNIYKDGNKTSLKVMGLTGKDSGLFGCSAVYEIGSSEGHVKVKVLSYMVPLKPFLAIATEVIILVSLILVYERHTKKKKNLAVIIRRLTRPEPSPRAQNPEQHCTTVTDKPVSPTTSTTVTDKPVSPTTSTTVTDKPVSPTTSTTVTDKPVSPTTSTTVTDKPVSPTTSTTVTDKPVSPTTSTTVTDKPVSPTTSTTVTDKPVSPTTSTTVTDKPVSPTTSTTVIYIYMSTDLMS